MRYAEKCERKVPKHVDVLQSQVPYRLMYNTSVMGNMRCVSLLKCCGNSQVQHVQERVHCVL